jgi:exodeoxyribonuclease VII large subunit
MGDDRLDVMDTPASNIPEYSVSEISGAIKRTLEGAFGRVRVRGELTEVKRYGSGHIYLSLKDENGKISGVIWKSVAGRLSVQPENGIEVIATGRVTSYADRSNYQLMIERLDYAGAGALLARIEALRVRLAEEGLFAATRRRKLPRLPALIGVITSAQGAVWHDICTTIARRFARPIVLWPVPVQGEGAAARIAAAIEGFGALPLTGVVRRPDVLIVARGGGSLEDLMAFNDEAVVRAAAACPIPLISAVGHETDTTLIDHAADQRAPTPTAAAELAVPVRAELLADLAHTAARLLSGVSHLAGKRRLDLHRAERGLPDLPALANLARQRLDDRSLRLAQALPARLVLARRSAVEVGRRLDAGLPLRMARAAAAIDLRASQLQAALRHAVAARHTAAAGVLSRLSEAPLRARLREARARLAGSEGLLRSLSYRAVLERGYALVADGEGRPLTRAAEVQPGAALRLEFADGTVGARALPNAGPGARPPAGPGQSPGLPSNQGSLL